jgi:putative hemolysin
MLQIGSTIAGLGLVASCLFVPTSLHAEGAKLAQANTQMQKPAEQLQMQRPTLKRVPGKDAGGTAKNPGHATVNLTTHDCTNTRGTVITVTDGRCGSSGQYCKYPDGFVICIDKKD